MCINKRSFHKQSACKMASVGLKLDSICRLCLSENKAILLPATEVINASLTSDDIERCTGVRVGTEDEGNISYAICEVCYEKLHKFNAYRAFCMSNDECFRGLYLSLYESNGDEARTNSPAFDHAYFSSKLFNLNPDSDCANTLENDEKEKLEDLIMDTDFVKMDPQNTFEELNEIFATSTSPERDDKPHTEVLAVTNLPVHGNEKKPRKKYVRRAPVKTPENRPKRKRIRKKLPKTLCPECGKLVVHFPHHMLTHTKEQNFTCEYCPGKFGRKSLLKLHVDAVHLKKTVKSCEICGKEFTHKTSYTSHMRAVHNIGEWYDCKICNLKFRHPGGLRRHNNSKHNAEADYPCTICGMTFQDKMRLRDHLRVHSDEQPFACRYCTKRFKSRNARRTHQLIHQGVVFPCSYCDKTYSYSSLLNMHVKKVHLPQQAEQTEEN